VSRALDQRERHQAVNHVQSLDESNLTTTPAKHHSGHHKVIKRTRVLHVTYDMGIGGTEQVIRQLVCGLDQNRYENHIVCLDGQIGPLGELLREQGVRFHVLHRKPGLDRALVLALRELLDAHDIDIVHTHQYTPYVYGVTASLFKRQRVVFTEHGRFYPDRASWKRRLINPWLSLVTDAIVAISSATGEALRYYEWFPGSSIRVIYNGIDGHREHTNEASVSVLSRLRCELGIETKHCVFGTISRLDSIKNQSMMIAALAQLLPRNPDCRLLLVGDGPERNTLEQQARTLGIGSQVIFAGYQSPPDAHLQLIDHFLLTSLSEGTSMTLLEAMAAGKSCIVTDVGGNPELVTHNVDGLVIPSNATHELVQRMQALLDDPALSLRLGTAAQKTFAERFELSHMIAAYEALYSQETNPT